MPLAQNTFTLVVADIDGVLMDNSHRDHLVPTNGGPRTEDWEAFNQACADDVPIQHMIDLVNYLALTPGHMAVLCTGRTETCRTITLDTLLTAGLRPAMCATNAFARATKNADHRNMFAHFRPADDHRKGWEYKADAVKRMVEFFQPATVVFIDDDQRNIDSVVAMCADIGQKIIPITVRPHGGCPAVASNLPPAAPRYSLLDARDDLVELLAQAKEDRAPGEIGLAEALDFLDECLGDPKDPPHASHAAGWIAKDHPDFQNDVQAAAGSMTQVPIER